MSNLSSEGPMSLDDNPRSKDLHRLYSAVLAQALNDYTAFAYPSNRESADDWKALISSAHLIFGSEVPQPLLDPDTQLPITNHELIKIVSKHSPRAIEKIRQAARSGARRTIYRRPQISVPDTFVSEKGVPWQVETDPKETTAYAHQTADGMGTLYIGPEKENRNFFIGLLTVAASEAGVDLDPDDLDAIGESLHGTLVTNKFFRVRALASINVPVIPMDKPLPKRKKRSKK